MFRMGVCPSYMQIASPIILMRACYSYNTQIDPISDALELSLSLDILNNIAVDHTSDISEKIAWVVMSQEYLSGSREAQARYLAEFDQYNDNMSEWEGATSIPVPNCSDGQLYSGEPGASLTASISLEPKEDSSLKSAIQAAQVYKKALGNMRNNIKDWRVRDPGSRHMYNQVIVKHLILDAWL